MLAFPSASESGLGADHARRLRPVPTALGVTAGLFATIIAAGWWAGPLVVAAIVGTAATCWLSMRKIGGLSGDVLGAIEQVTECLVLVVVSGLATRHSLWWS